MAWTAAHEHYGANLVASFGVDYTLPLPTRQGGARFLSLKATTTGLDVTLPDATTLRPGGDPQYTVLAEGSNAFDIVDSDGGTVQTVSVGSWYELLLADNSTAAGTWLVRSGTYAKGTGLTAARQPVELTIASDSDDVILTNHALANGWDGDSAAAVTVTIAAGVRIGSTSTNPADAAMWSGAFPTGSTLLLIIEAGAVISGRGGNGGRGGDTPSGLLSQIGTEGGLALSVGLNTSLVNYGTIQGGGGGGGGGAQSGGQAGGGGGGGVGHWLGSGGAGGSGGGGFPGLSGTLYVAGGGGAGGQQGGTGGTWPGGTGNTAGAAGGAAGAAVEYPAAGVWNKIRTGTIYGSEVPV